MKEFLKGCFLGLVIIGSVAAFVGALHMVSTVRPWISFTVLGSAFVLGLGLIF